MPRPHKGPRHAYTIRIPVALDARYKHALARSGHDNMNDFVVEVLESAEQAGLTREVAAASKRDQQLPLTA
jgi:hypothetical protein